MSKLSSHISKIDLPSHLYNSPTPMYTIPGNTLSLEQMESLLRQDAPSLG